MLDVYKKQNSKSLKNGLSSSYNSQSTDFLLHTILKLFHLLKKMLYLNRAVYCRINGGHSINGVSKVINLKKYYQGKVPFKSDIFLK